MNALKDVVARGLKADNGFRSGAMNMVEAWLRKDFPNTDLRLNPHINSKITAWKKFYYSLSGMLERSGVGFNLHGDYKVECDNDQWAQIEKSDRNARGMRFKSWPLWDDWQYVFGKDRAIGVTGEGVYDVMKEKAPVANIADTEDNGDYHVIFDDFLGDELVQPTPTPTGGTSIGEESTAQSEKEVRVPKKTGRKRKVDDEGEGLLNLLGKLHTETNARLETLSTRIGYEMDLGKATQEIFRHLDNIPWLSEEQQYDLCDIIDKENSRLEIFMGLPDFKKPGYVKRVLKKESLI